MCTTSRTYRWEAKLRLNGGKRSIGSYATKEVAAEAYDCAATKVYGKYAKLNFAAAEIAGVRPSTTTASEAMKKLILLALLASSAPTVDLPLPARQSNWCDGDGNGSCVVASFVSLLRWQGRPCTAEHFRRTYSGPQGPTRFDATPRRGERPLRRDPQRGRIFPRLVDPHQARLRRGGR